jgi:hypothetical protein
MDLFDFPHPPIGINMTNYGPGRHFVDADVADWIEDRLQKKFESDIRVMRPQQDYVSQSAMNRHGVGARSGQHSTNPDAEMAG